MLEETTEVIKKIQARMKTSQSRQKNYADKRRRPLEFEAGDKVFLKVFPMRGVMRFGKKGKLSPRFTGPFEILQRVGKVAYRLALPPSMSNLHDVFHVSIGSMSQIPHTFCKIKKLIFLQRLDMKNL